MRSAITKRVSRRSFTGEDLDSAQIAAVRSLISAVNQESGLAVRLEEDGSIGFINARNTYGLFRNVHSVILMKGRPDLPDFREKVGYFGERLILDLVDMGLGACWVGGSFDSSAYTIPETEEIQCVIVVGNIEAPGLKEKLLMAVNHRKRKPVQDRISSDTELPAWVNAGMEAVVLAPSSVNRQKPHFDYRDGVLTASVRDTGKFDLTDLGIAKLHFEIGAEDGGRFPLGNGAAYMPGN